MTWLESRDSDLVTWDTTETVERGMVMYTCPNTGKWTPVQQMDRASFDLATFHGIRVACPHCHLGHTVDKRDSVFFPDR